MDERNFIHHTIPTGRHMKASIEAGLTICSGEAIPYGGWRVNMQAGYQTLRGTVVACFVGISQTRPPNSTLRELSLRTL